MKAIRRYRYAIFTGAALCAVTVVFALALTWWRAVLFSAWMWGWALNSVRRARKQAKKP